MREERFKIGDPVRILPRFAHLYPSAFGVVIAFKRDPYRDLFNEYSLKFPDGTTTSVFEFQLVEVQIS